MLIHRTRAVLPHQHPRTKVRKGRKRNYESRVSRWVSGGRESFLALEATVESSDPSLESATGADWNETCAAAIPLYVFHSDSQTATEAAASAAVAAWTVQVLDVYYDGVLDTIADNPSENSWSFTWPFWNEAMAGFEFAEGVDEVFAAFGKVKLVASIVVDVERTGPLTGRVGSVRLQGTLDDLYDWGHDIVIDDDNTPDWDILAAAVQAAFPTMSPANRPNSGQIYRSRVLLDNTATLAQEYTYEPDA